MTYSISDLLNRLDIVARNEFVIGIKELDARFRERSLGQQQAFDTG